MNIAIFNKTYWVRRFRDQSVVKGYVTTPHQDFTVSLNVHPPSADTIQALPEGERKIKRLEASGTDVLLASDQERGIKGDLLYYHNNWYECISAIEWDHTILNHWNYVFVLVPNDAAGTIDLTEPESTEDTESTEDSDEIEDSGETEDTSGSEDTGDSENTEESEDDASEDGEGSEVNDESE